MTLIKEINDLRRELKISRTALHDMEAVLGLNKNKKTGDMQAVTQILNKQPPSVLETKIEEQVSSYLQRIFCKLLLLAKVMQFKNRFLKQCRLIQKYSCSKVVIVLRH